jgi:hypothetical protein
MVRITKIHLRGWTEILFRLCSLERLPNFDSIDPDDYMAVGSLHPLAEYERPFQIYEAFADGKGFAQPRPLRRYDIINIATTAPRRGVTSLLLVKREVDIHLIHQASQIYYTEARPLALLPLPVAMPFRRGII